MVGFEIVKKDNKIYNKYIQPVVVFLLLLADFVAYTSIFEVGISNIMAVGLMGAATGLAYYIQSIKWNFKKVIIAFLSFFVGGGICYHIFDWLNATTILNGIGSLLKTYYEVYNKYYNTSIYFQTEYTNYMAVLFVFLVIQICVSMMLTFVIRKRKWLIIALIIGFEPVGRAALVGYMPSTISTLILIAATLIFVMCYKKQNTLTRKDFIVSLAVLGVLFVASVFSSWKLYEFIDEHNDQYLDARYKIQRISNTDIQDIINTTGNDLSNYARGGIGEGDFRTLTQFVPSGEIHLEVIVDELPKEDLYLRAYVGTKYTNNGWEAMQGYTFSRLISMWSDSDVRNVLLSEPYNRVSEGTSVIETSHIYVTITGGSMEYAYAPYYAYIPNSENVVMDSYVSGARQEEHEFVYYPRYQVDNLNDSQLAESSEIWKNYQEFVWEEYLDYPDDMSQLETFCENINSDSVQDIETSLNNYFQNGFIYSYVPGKYPKDEDFVEYFMFTKHRGFCVHYATAATIVYRACGYPARYVEGYKVDVEDFKLQEDGTYKAYVTDKKAHAWCETFDNEKGWQLKEHTIGYGNGQEELETTTPDQLSTSTNSEEETNAIETSSQPSVTSSSEATKGGANIGKVFKVEKTVISIIVKVIFAIVLFILLITFVMAIRRHRKLLKFKYIKDNKGILYIYNEICEICTFRGLNKENKSDKDLIGEIKQKFPQLKEEEWDWIYNCAERAAFSNEIITREEHRRMYVLYRKFRRHIYRELGNLSKIYFLYIQGM